MNIHILGAATGMPTLGLHHAAVAVYAADRTFLLDVGEGVSKQLMRTGLDGEALDFVAVSHYHPDHLSGLFMLLQMLKLQRRRKPLDVYLPEREDDMAAILRMFYTFPETMGFELRLLPMETLHDNEPFLTPLPSDHLHCFYDAYVEKQGLSNPCLSWSFMVEKDGRRAIYTADVQKIEALEPYLDGSDMLIIDALHPSADVIMALAERKIARIVLTHGLSSAIKPLMNNNPAFEIANESTDYTV
ncbi:MAG: MBL fold metallo-hydrolase [Candidatus Cloacimonetes bacterium]|nr:MBL fold metallo-hydrolase [Candidatus Cloacimonadota bacterium]